MSEQEMNRISKKMSDTYTLICRYLETGKSGKVNVLKNVLCQGLGLSPRTANEYLDMLEGNQIYTANNQWKWIGNNAELDRFKALKATMMDDEERMKYRAPQE